MDIYFDDELKILLEEYGLVCDVNVSVSSDGSVTANNEIMMTNSGMVIDIFSWNFSFGAILVM